MSELEPASTPASVPRVNVADGQEHRLDPKSVLAARLAGGIAASIFGGLSFVFATLFLFSTGRRGLSVLFTMALWLVVAVGFGLLTQFWPALRYRYTSYQLDESVLRIRRGVIWRSETSLPRNRVQHTDVSRGPIERSFGLATLIVHTAGTENASVSLGGLPSDRAYLIRDVLIAEGGTDDAV